MIPERLRLGLYIVVTLGPCYRVSNLPVSYYTLFCLFVYLPNCLYVSVCLPIRPTVRLYVFMLVCLPVCVCLNASMCACLSLCLSVCLSVCPSLSTKLLSYIYYLLAISSPIYPSTILFIFSF